VNTARHGSASASGGYTTIPNSNSTTGRSGCPGRGPLALPLY
jgi:hypothetical protein